MKIFSSIVNPFFLVDTTIPPPSVPPETLGAQVKFFEPFFVLNPPVGLQVLSDSGVEPVVIGFTTSFADQGTNVVGFHAVFEE